MMKDLEGSETDPGVEFKRFPLMLLLGVPKDLKDKPVVAAIEGSRNFLPPAGLGGMRYQGAAVAVFAGDITAQASEFLADPQPAGQVVQNLISVKKERIGGRDVAVLKGKAEEDIWTTYIAFPKPNVAVAATDESYLRETLARIDGQAGPRALPGTLPEWKYVNTQSPFWAVRHYQRSGAGSDPTSPFGQCAGVLDDKAIGLAFSFDPAASNTARIAFLSGDKDAFQRIQKTFFPERETGVKDMRIQYREIEPGVLEGSYNVEKMPSAEYFVFVLEGLLGHGIYL